MGYHIHHGMMFTSFKLEHLEKLHAKAKEIFGRWCVSEITHGQLNGFSSFSIVPDGSKEGWPDSEDYDEKRKSLKQNAKEMNLFVDWVEFSFGGDEPDIHTKIIDSGHYTEDGGI